MTFVEFARANGVQIDDLRSGLRIHRCGTTEHPRSDNGAYSWDGRRGWVMAWDGDGQAHWYDDPGEPWTPEAKAKASKQWPDKSRQHQEAASRSAAVLAGCELRAHAYLRIKGFPAMLGLVGDGRLFIPMRSLSGSLVGYQKIEFIDGAWEKKMLHGMRAKGAVLRLGDGTETWLVEGYATGLSVRAAITQMHLRAAVMVCFSASNLAHVSKIIQGRAYVAADNDESKTGERAAVETGLPWVMPETAGNDWNDEHVLRGVGGLCQAIRDVRKEAQAA